MSSRLCSCAAAALREAVGTVPGRCGVEASGVSAHRCSCWRSAATASSACRSAAAASPCSCSSLARSVSSCAAGPPLPAASLSAEATAERPRSASGGTPAASSPFSRCADSARVRSLAADTRSAGRGCWESMAACSFCRASSAVGLLEAWGLGEVGRRRAAAVAAAVVRWVPAPASAATCGQCRQRAEGIRQAERLRGAPPALGSTRLQRQGQCQERQKLRAHA